MAIIIPGRYRPAPSPFDAKPRSGTPIDWMDPCSEGLQLCWGFNEEQGKYVYESVRAAGSGSRSANPFDLWFGPETAFGTGVNASQWVQSEGTTGLQIFKNNGQSLNFFTPGFAVGVQPIVPPIDFRKGYSIECWARWQAPTTPGDKQGVCEIANQFEAGSGRMFEMFMDGPRFRVSAWGTGDVVDSATYSSEAVMPNHIVVTWDGGREWAMYGNGVLLARQTTAVTPFYNTGGSGERNMYLLIGNHTNLQVAHINAIWYKFSVYNTCLGEDAVALLAQNPMRVYRQTPVYGNWENTVIPPTLPQVTLQANPAQIFTGASSTLTWTSLNADTLVIDQGLGDVSIPSGGTDVFPPATTTYTITATNASGSAQAQATVVVVERGGGRPPDVAEGAILQRDLNVRSDAASGGLTDDGTPYSAFATIGSIVLTQPSELALILFLTTECKAVGAHPSMSVLLDEIESTVSAPFENIDSFVPDPPVLDAAQTVYNDRFYISRTQQPAVCRHMQVKVTWPAERSANELLTWSVIGAHVDER